MLLVVVLVMVVALTVGLSVASRTITNLKISKQNEDAQKAFQAAETGIQEALQQMGNHTLTGTLSNNASFNAMIQPVQGNSMLLNGGEDVLQDKGMDVWLSTYPNYSSPTFATSSGTITLYFGTGTQTSCSKGSDQNNPTGSSVKSALEILILYSNVSNPLLDKLIIDSCTPTRIVGSGLSSATSTIISDVNDPYVSVTFSDTYTINITPALQSAFIMKIVPLFNSTKIGISISGTGVTLPSQGSFIQSTGSSGDSARRIQYFKPYPQLPAELFYSVIGQNN